MESLLYQMDLQTDHEQKICKQLEINECSFLFMESPVYQMDLHTDHELDSVLKARFGAEWP